MKPFILIITIILISCRTSEFEGDKKPLDQILDQQLTQFFRPDRPGCVILVTRKGEIIYNKAFGMANVEHHTSLKTDDVFRIASITKQFTAIAILQLVQKRLISLDDPVTKFIADYPSQGYNITLRHLLSHTSGVKNITEISDIEERSSRTPLEVIDIFKNRPLDFEPGTAFKYSNSNYIILGWIIEKTSGLSYAEYVVKHIFEPLNMKDAFYERSDSESTGLVTGYTQISDSTYRPARHIDMSNVYAAGALSMTVADLLKFNEGLHALKLINKELLELALSPIMLPDGSRTPYGFGWGLGTFEGVANVQHSGAIAGFTSFQIYMPAEEVFVAIFSNSENANLVGHALLAVSLAANLPCTNEFYPSEDALEGYVGTYEAEDSYKFFIYKKDKSLFWDNGQVPPRQMHFISDSTFLCYEVFPYRHTFTKDGYIVDAGDLFIKTKRVHL